MKEFNGQWKPEAEVDFKRKLYLENQRKKQLLEEERKTPNLLQRSFQQGIELCQNLISQKNQS